MKNSGSALGSQKHLAPGSPSPWAGAFREARGAITQEEASKILCGCPLGTIRDWEQGRRTPPEWVQYLVVGRLMRGSQEPGARSQGKLALRITRGQ